MYNYFINLTTILINCQHIAVSLVIHRTLYLYIPIRLFTRSKHKPATATYWDMSLNKVGTSRWMSLIFLLFCNHSNSSCTRLHAVELSVLSTVSCCDLYIHTSELNKLKLEFIISFSSQITGHVSVSPIPLSKHPSLTKTTKIVCPYLWWLQSGNIKMPIYQTPSSSA